MERKKARILAAGMALFLGGCQAVGNFADRVGEHMPVLGERCEHWQCFTESGQKQGELNKERMAQPTPHAPVSPQAATPPKPSAPPSMPPKPLTPFDMPDPTLSPLQ